MNENLIYDYTIIGGGIVGLATAYEIQKKYPKSSILVIEKENILSNHQTGNNSGVIHSGIYYTPGSLKATNCKKGRKMLVEFAKAHNIPFEICGKLIVAVDNSELDALDKIYNNGINNQIEDIKLIDKEEIKKHEPFVNGIKAIYVGCTGIIDFRATVNKIAEIISDNSNSQAASIKVNTKYLYSNNKQDYTEIHTSNGIYKSKRNIFCGGLQADRLAKKNNLNIKERVVPFRGDYYELTEGAKNKVKNLIYPVPDPKFPFLGVHFTRMTTGETECGPNAVLAFKREGYSKISFNFKDFFNAITYRGTWKLLFSNFSYAMNEYRRAFSKKLFLKTLQRLIPSLQMNDIKVARSGVRAQLLGINGETRDDFRIEKNERDVHVLNAPSPAATAAFAIGEYIVDNL